jgi:hypothetical protein
MKRLTRKLLALGYLSSIAVATLGFTATVHALPSQEVTTIYYSDQSKTEEVGELTLLCDGQRVQSGQRTRYATRSSSPCNGGGPNPPDTGHLPCEFLARGCSSIPDRYDGHFGQ